MKLKKLINFEGLNLIYMIISIKAILVYFFIFICIYFGISYCFVIILYCPSHLKKWKKTENDSPWPKSKAFQQAAMTNNTHYTQIYEYSESVENSFVNRK